MSFKALETEEGIDFEPGGSYGSAKGPMRKDSVQWYVPTTPSKLDRMSNYQKLVKVRWRLVERLRARAYRQPDVERPLLPLRFNTPRPTACRLTVSAPEGRKTQVEVAFRLCLLHPLARG